MSFQLLLNVFLAFLWMFLQNSYDTSTFLIGYILGLIIMFAFRRYFHTRFYVGRVWAIIKLILLFLKELVLSNISVLKLVIKPQLDIEPGIFALPTDLKKDWEIVVLSNLITLTPGTLVVKVSDDQKTIFVHALNIGEKEEEIKGIKNTFEKAIMEVSR
ncbi:multisubunit sodium/proton antiporter MrpE subunit [Bacillus oleivorans]|uniref:Multisubunit sodium/proton antiporter MrpE subunit n=1 Tax=Bacillus oleivorans TaxID=1448271 RepID=A0A285D5Z6_9BACI|nr:Na+/H+ antiporter subunit E [Bacillus oleivorans]SNX75234.1 multisubunit sodium/proton antiporter MrpE subunit [Bacillus oleivorans]